LEWLCRSPSGTLWELGRIASSLSHLFSGASARLRASTRSSPAQRAAQARSPPMPHWRT
jgi:hypothetical protein